MDVPVRTPDLEELRRRRADLRETLGAVEDALAAAATDRAVIWGERVHAAALALKAEFVEHVDVNEGPDGLHQMIMAGDLRLANGVARLTADHAVITAEIAVFVKITEPPVVPADVDAIRDSGTRLLARIIRHRQRGADLVYEAYATDLGGCD